jgi:hypothetical protein
LVLVALTAFPAFTADPAPASQTGCLACHQGIEPIREAGSEMLRQIIELADAASDPQGCVVCHGGDPQATDKDGAHRGPEFYPAPASPWVNEKTCGQCHEDHVGVQWHSLMMTEAGKIQGTAWSFGGLTGYEHRWGNYDVENPQDPKQRWGTDLYRDYMQRLKTLEPQVFVDRHEALPAAPTDLSLLKDHPELAAFTYMRNQCQRCHHAVKGRETRGDFRGIGCSSCHLPYSTEGFYEGHDPSVPRDKTGHVLVHSIQSSRKTKVEVHGKQYSGIPINTCTVCHNRGKRIGVSFQGLMETPYASPYAEDGSPAPELRGKHYLAMHQDVHYQKGMLCGDCHTTIDVHGDGFLAASNLAAVEIECADCHGTPQAFPWELPLGYGDEFDTPPASGPARGTATELLRQSKQGTVYPVQDGYLLTARGNPMPKVVRGGDAVIVHCSGGKDLPLKPLKMIQQEKGLSQAGHIAMEVVQPHIRKIECYTCHTSWSPQCYGCHVRIDYSGNKSSFDWLAAGHRHARPECAADRGESGYDTMIPGVMDESRSYTRWEEPILGINGEGRVTPITPGCQPVFTVIGPDGQPILRNKIFRTPAGTEGGGDEGQLAIDMSPTQPHTTTKEARTCESCHLSDKALGYGLGSGKTTRPPDQPLVVDLETADQQVLPHRTRPQAEPIEGLGYDWSQVVTEDGKQLQTVGHHFRLDRPLNNQERANMDRRGVCLGCHQEIPDRSLAVSLLHHVAEYSNQLPKNRDEHTALTHKILLFSAWGQAALALGVPLALALAAVWHVRRRRRWRNLSRSPGER